MYWSEVLFTCVPTCSNRSRASLLKTGKRNKNLRTLLIVTGATSLVTLKLLRRQPFLDNDLPGCANPRVTAERVGPWPTREKTSKTRASATG